MAHEAEMTIIGMDEDVLAVFLKFQLIGSNRALSARSCSASFSSSIISARDLPPHHGNLQALGLSPQAFPSSGLLPVW
jgi:hypothetical protein